MVFKNDTVNFRQKVSFHITALLNRLAVYMVGPDMYTWSRSDPEIVSDALFRFCTYLRCHRKICRPEIVSR